MRRVDWFLCGFGVLASVLIVAGLVVPVGDDEARIVGGLLVVGVVLRVGSILVRRGVK